MIKVALISHSPNFTGAEKMLFQLAIILRNTQRYIPIVFIPLAGEHSALMEACRGNEIETVGYSSGRWYIWSEAESLGCLSTEILENRDTLERLYLQYGIDLVVVNTLTQIAPMLAAKKVNLPTCLWVHGILDSYIIPQGDPMLRLLLDRYVMNLSDQIVCCSEWTANYYKPIASKPIQVITNWTEPPIQMAPISALNAFVCLNTFDKNKGVDTLIEAAEILAEKGYSFSIRLYGTGGEESLLHTHVQEKKLENIVHFCGRTNDVDAVYQSCSCLVQPSYIESFGLTMVEAMAHGRPVISARNGGGEMIVKHGETGYLVPKKDAEVLAERMAELMDEPELSEKMGMAGRKRYEELFSPEKARMEFTTLFDAMVSKMDRPSQADILLEDTWDWIFGHYHYKENICAVAEPKPEAVQLELRREAAQTLNMKAYRRKIKRILNWLKKPDIHDMIMSVNPTVYSSACIQMGVTENQTFKESERIPWNDYVEYTVRGAGTKIHYILIGNETDFCMIEAVCNNRIIMNSIVPVKSGRIVSCRLGEVNGPVQMRFRAITSDARIYTVEYLELLKVHHRVSLFGWIS